MWYNIPRNQNYSGNFAHRQLICAYLRKLFWRNQCTVPPQIKQIVTIMVYFFFDGWPCRDNFGKFKNAKKRQNQHQTTKTENQQVKKKCDLKNISTMWKALDWTCSLCSNDLCIIEATQSPPPRDWIGRLIGSPSSERFHANDFAGIPKNAQITCKQVVAPLFSKKKIKGP